MRIMRIVPNIATKDVERAKTFYRDILGLDVAMDMGWITTFEADAVMRPQLSVAAHGGSATAVPDFTIEVDDRDRIWTRYGAMGRETLLCPRSLRTAAQYNAAFVKRQRYDRNHSLSLHCLRFAAAHHRRGVGPRVRIRLPPAASPQTLGPSVISAI